LHRRRNLRANPIAEIETLTEIPDEIWRLVLTHERELGSLSAQQSATSKDVSDLTQEVRNGFSKLGDDVSRSIGGLRAEMKTAADEAEKRRRDDLQHFKTLLQDRDDEQREREAGNWRLVRNALIGLGLLLGAMQTGAIVLNQGALQTAADMAAAVAP
jgi:hypothetical protein